MQEYRAEETVRVVRRRSSQRPPWRREHWNLTWVSVRELVVWRGLNEVKDTSIVVVANEAPAKIYIIGTTLEVTVFKQCDDSSVVLNDRPPLPSLSLSYTFLFCHFPLSPSSLSSTFTVSTSHLPRVCLCVCVCVWTHIHFPTHLFPVTHESGGMGYLRSLMDEVDTRRNVCEWEEWVSVCVCYGIGTTSMLRLIRTTVVLVWMWDTFDVSLEKNVAQQIQD